jgi:hypothetical protein
MMAGEEEQEAAFRLQRALDDFAKNAPQLKATLARIRHIEGQLATSPHRRGAGVTDESLIATLSDGKNRLERWELSCCLQSEEDLLITRGLQDLRTGRLFLRKKWNVSEARNYLKSSIAKFQIAEQSCQDTRRQELLSLYQTAASKELDGLSSQTPKPLNVSESVLGRFARLFKRP